ncbi:PQQ-binding-like beta-propeller repeat protein [Mucilaginibacter boryungensis]|uniref:WD40 repeat protein n=1 Tax=Mucilaginibacter boryungensis TaxID=768480 RepID=A0ABR9XGK8_9SPHI|nr:hypothetical protein [Mucilaginibacter boryungensis]MBE9666533.1 hypothetical protein [Mucilaginibacter boryungensis]
MRNIAKLLPTLLLLFVIHISRAQEFGGNPPSIKWNQVNSPEVKVIFPIGMDSAGKRVAAIIYQMSRPILPTIGYKQKQISVVLQNQNTISNAYVGLAPFRSEFYLTPEQNSFEIGSLNWVDQLAIHEYRHVQQYNNFNVGASRALRILFGEAGQAIGNELAIPNWFFEGDAVYNETHVSLQGRGRIPYFFNGYRALWAAGKDYSYMKLRNGSYVDYVPDHYPLGYMLVAYGREKYGNDFWKNVTHDAAAFKAPFYPFQNGFKRYAGVDFNQFRTGALQSFKQKFSDMPDARPNKKQHFIADQEYPAYVNDETLIYMKSSYKHRDKFVMRKGSVEKDIRIRDISLDNYFAYHNGKIVYAAYVPDPRWGYRTYSDLRLLDINSGEQKKLTHHTKYFSPDFSSDGQRIVAVQTAPSGKTEIHILNAADGKLLTVVPNPQDVFYTYPKFYGDDQLVSAVRSKDGAMHMATIDIKTGKINNLLSTALSAFPVVKHDTIYFSAPLGNNDRLFALNAKNRKLYLLNTNEMKGDIGNYQPTVSNNKLAWTSFTAYGYQVHEADKKAITWTDITTNGAGSLSDFGIHSLEKDSAANVLAKVQDEPLAVTKYSKAHHLFNFHSLIPDFNDPNYTISLEGENVLNTFQSSLLFNYNRDEGYKKFGFGGVYGGLYPYLTGSVNYTVDRKGYYKGNDVYWNETELRVGALVPLLFTNGTQITRLSFGTDVIYNSTSFQAAYRNTFADRSYTYLNSSIAISNHISQPKQNIYPRFGQSLSLNYKYAIHGADANQFLVSGALYLPGLLTNHNLVITGAFQQKNRNSVISFSNNFPFARGYTAENLYQLEKVGVNYHFPIAYPDAGIANAFYISRLRGNLFYDYTHANDFFTNGNPFKANFRSVGGEVYFDTSWFNQVPITLGIRYSHLLDDDVFGGYGRNRIELIVPLTLF